LGFCRIVHLQLFVFGVTRDYYFLRLGMGQRIGNMNYNDLIPILSAIGFLHFCWFWIMAVIITNDL